MAVWLKIQELGLTCYEVMKPKSGSAPWWNNLLSDVDCLWFRDFKGWVNYTLMLQLLDQFQMQLPTKGGFIHIPNIKYVFFCSSIEVHAWWPRTCETEYLAHRTVLGEFARRITNIYGPTIGEQYQFQLRESRSNQGVVILKPPDLVLVAAATVAPGMNMVTRNDADMFADADE